MRKVLLICCVMTLLLVSLVYSWPLNGRDGKQLSSTVGKVKNVYFADGTSANNDVFTSWVEAYMHTPMDRSMLQNLNEYGDNQINYPGSEFYSKHFYDISNDKEGGVSVLGGDRVAPDAYHALFFKRFSRFGNENTSISLVTAKLKDFANDNAGGYGYAFSSESNSLYGNLYFNHIRKNGNIWVNNLYINDTVGCHENGLVDILPKVADMGESKFAVCYLKLFDYQVCLSIVSSSLNSGTLLNTYPLMNISINTIRWFYMDEYSTNTALFWYIQKSTDDYFYLRAKLISSNGNETLINLGNLQLGSNVYSEDTRAIKPIIRIDNNKGIYIIWEKDSAIKTVYVNPITFSCSSVHTISSANSNSPLAAVDSTNHLFVSWNQMSTPTTNRILLAKTIYNPQNSTWGNVSCWTNYQVVRELSYPNIVGIHPKRDNGVFLAWTEGYYSAYMDHTYSDLYMTAVNADSTVSVQPWNNEMGDFDESNEVEAYWYLESPNETGYSIVTPYISNYGNKTDVLKLTCQEGLKQGVKMTAYHRCFFEDDQWYVSTTRFLFEPLSSVTSIPTISGYHLGYGSANGYDMKKIYGEIHPLSIISSNQWYESVMYLRGKDIKSGNIQYQILNDGCGMNVYFDDISFNKTTIPSVLNSSNYYVITTNQNYANYWGIEYLQAHSYDTSEQAIRFAFTGSGQVKMTTYSGYAISNLKNAYLKFDVKASQSNLGTVYGYLFSRYAPYPYHIGAEVDVSIPNQWSTYYVPLAQLTQTGTTPQILMSVNGSGTLWIKNVKLYYQN